MGKNRAWWKKKSEHPQQVGTIIENWLRNNKLIYNWKLFKLGANWHQISDAKMKQHTRIINFRNHVLEVAVDSPSYHFELNFGKGQLLNRLRQKCPEVYVQDIRFVIGDIEGE